MLQSAALPGLKAHNPLGFLAACGLLRSCAMSPVFGLARLAWIEEPGEGGFIATLSGETESSINPLRCKPNPDVQGLTQLLNRRCEQQITSPALTWSSKIKDDPQKFRDAAQQLLEPGRMPHDETCDRLQMFSALASDLITDEKMLRSTMLDLTSGNQRLLKSIRAVAGERESGDGNNQLLSEEAVREALFGPWQYRDDHHALGWDPSTQRLHALRHKLPEQDKTNRSVRAAVFLASQALPLFPCFAVGRKLRTTAFHRYEDHDWFAWPIWRDPISLETLQSLLVQAFTADLKHRGVEIVYRCRRVRTGGAEGNYQVFSHVQQRPWPQRRKRRDDSVKRRRSY